MVVYSKKGIPYKDKKQKKLKSVNDILKSLIIDFIAKKSVADGENLSEAKMWISKNHKVAQLNTILIKIIRNGELTDPIKNELKEFINEIFEEKGVARINLRNNIFNQLGTVISNPIVAEDEENLDDIFTIHSVKGETLRSVLVVDFNDKPLTQILLHRYGVNDNDNYLYTNHNLLYVAMSRVTHLFVFAMHLDDWTQEVREKLQPIWAIKEAQLEVLI